MSYSSINIERMTKDGVSAAWIQPTGPTDGSAGVVQELRAPYTPWGLNPGHCYDLQIAAAACTFSPHNTPHDTLAALLFTTKRRAPGSKHAGTTRVGRPTVTRHFPRSTPEMEHSIPQQAHVTFLDRTGSAFGSRAEHVCSRACRFACARRAAWPGCLPVPLQGSTVMLEDLVPLR